MIRAEQIVPVVKELVYHIHSEDTNDISKLKALLKFDSICMDTMADMLEAKAKDDCNIFLLRNFIYYHSIYAKAYNFLFDRLQLVEVASDEKAAILKMISEIDEIDDVNEIIAMIDSLTAKVKNKVENEDVKLLKEQDEKVIESNVESEITEKTIETVRNTTEEIKVPENKCETTTEELKTEKVNEEGNQTTVATKTPNMYIQSNKTRTDKGNNSVKGKGRATKRQK